MASRRRSRHIEIFNFSFLDILACTIGLLIFIMVMVFILQAGSPIADAQGMIQHKLGRAAALNSRSAQDVEIAAAVEAQLNAIHSPIAPNLAPQRDAARTARDQARARFEQTTSQARQAQAQLDAARLAREASSQAQAAGLAADLSRAHQRHDQAAADLAKATAPPAKRVIFVAYKPPGAEDQTFQVLHVDCRATAVAILQIQVDGTPREVGATPRDKLSDPDSQFMQAVRGQQQSKHPLVVLWVRPDGMATFEAARAALPPGTEYGYEPATDDWRFQVTP